jgi:hypothetical protein
MNKVIFKLKYGNFPECIERKDNEILNFAIYNFYWDLNYFYFTRIDYYRNGYHYTRADKINSRHIQYTEEDTHEHFEHREGILGELKECNDIFQAPIEIIEEHFNMWLDIAKEMYE